MSNNQRLRLKKNIHSNELLGFEHLKIQLICFFFPQQSSAHLKPGRRAQRKAQIQKISREITKNCCVFT